MRSGLNHFGYSFEPALPARIVPVRIFPDGERRLRDQMSIAGLRSRWEFTFQFRYAGTISANSLSQCRLAQPMIFAGCEQLFAQ